MLSIRHTDCKFWNSNGGIYTIILVSKQPKKPFRETIEASWWPFLPVLIRHWRVPRTKLAEEFVLLVILLVQVGARKPLRPRHHIC